VSPRAWAVLLALGSALLYAVTSVLQHSAAAEIDHRRSLRPGLLLDLVRHPRWLLGNLAEVGAVILQFVALRRGSLLLVQTLLVSGLLFALPMGAALQHRRLATADWLGTVAVVAGLGVFVGVARPSRGRGNASPTGWVAVLGLGCGAVAALVALAPRQPGPARATYLGGACGVLFGVDAALAKASGHLLNHGALHAARGWEPYALGALGIVGFLLAQSAFQAGPLAASLPLITAADPVAAALIGVLAFHERLASGGPAVAAQVLAGLAIVAGVWVLARSPLVAGSPVPAQPG
jgi:drug/metabolite transporter (DMT)-like permease